MTLSKDELSDLEDDILDEFTEILKRKNNEGTLKALLVTLGLEDLVKRYFPEGDKLQTWPEGKILVVGALERQVKNLKGLAKGLGIAEKRLEFVSYDEATNYDFDNLQYNQSYCALLFGASPHSARGKGSSRSILSELEASPNIYPTVRRLGEAELSVTKTSFRTALTELITEGIVSTDA